MADLAAALDCEVVLTRDGTPAMFDRATGELMHRTGPLSEARELYVEAARLPERLSTAEATPLVVLDVVLGAGANALAAWRCAELPRGTVRRALHIISLDRSTAALELALRSEHAAGFGLLEPSARAAAAALLEQGRHETARSRWIGSTASA